MKGAEPAGSSGSNDKNVGLIVGLTVGGLVFVVLAYFCSVRRSNKKEKHVPEPQKDVGQEQPTTEEHPTSLNSSEVM
jgi:hypothetical protein